MIAPTVFRDVSSQSSTITGRVIFSSLPDFPVLPRGLEHFQSRDLRLKEFLAALPMPPQKRLAQSTFKMVSWRKKMDSAAIRRRLPL